MDFSRIAKEKTQSEIQDGKFISLEVFLPPPPQIRKTGKTRLFIMEERDLPRVFGGKSIKEIIFPQTRAQQTLTAFFY